MKVYVWLNYYFSVVSRTESQWVREKGTGSICVCMYFSGCAFMTAKQNRISCPDKYLIIDFKSAIIKTKRYLLRQSQAGRKKRK